MAFWLTIKAQHGGIASIPATMDPDGEGLAYGTTIPNEIDRLNAIAKQLGVTSLDRFISKNPRGFQLILTEAEAEGNAVLASVMRAELSCINERPRWHEPEAARETIGSIKAFITNNPDTPIVRDRHWILWDLEAYDRILAELAADGDKFAFIQQN
jgi:hypothetical protein